LAGFFLDVYFDKIVKLYFKLYLSVEELQPIQSSVISIGTNVFTWSKKVVHFYNCIVATVFKLIWIYAFEKGRNNFINDVLGFYTKSIFTVWNNPILYQYKS